jgi:6-methylsalicylate decarboxylase
MLRTDTHHHAIPSFYRDLLRKAGIDEAGGRDLPEWSPEASLHAMGELNVATAILSVSTPGTAFLPSTADATSLARDINDYLAELVGAQPDRFGFFATIPMPHSSESIDEVVRSLDELSADGVVLLANSAGTYLGQQGQDDLFAALDARSARHHPRGVSAGP